MPCGDSNYQQNQPLPGDNSQYLRDATGEYQNAEITESECDNEALCWIKSHPVAAIAIALAVGLLLGRR